MACDHELLKAVPLFSLLDEEERAVLAQHVELRHFVRGHRIFRIGDPAGAGYIVTEGSVRITMIDNDQQEVTIDEPATGGFFGFASLLDGAPHQTSAIAAEATTCIEIDRDDLTALLRAKPDAGMDMLSTLGRHLHAAHDLVRMRSMRNANEIIEEQSTVGERIADRVAQFGGSWRFILTFLALLIVYVSANVALGRTSWDPYPFILLNLFLSMLAALQAPVIMMSQNRQDSKDRLRSELDFDVNRRAELEIRGLARQVHGLAAKLEDIEDAMQSKT